MTCEREYHRVVRHSISASILFASLAVALVIFVSPSQAQINGVPSSVTSPGFGGRAINGTPASVTSLGPQGFSPNFGGPFMTSPPPLRNGNHFHGRGRRHHHNQGEFFAPAIYAVPVPYAVDTGAADETDDSADDEDPSYQGGPTVFDRRGAGASSYVPTVNDVPRARVAHAAPAADPPIASDPEPPQQPTLLVFKDGHTQQVDNYAIVGPTLFDLTPGHPRRIALTALDLDATRKQNDDHGVVFQLPPTAVPN